MSPRGPRSLSPKYLLDTHVLLRWLIEPKKLAGGQLRILNKAMRRAEPVAISAVTLLEIAGLDYRRALKSKLDSRSLFSELQQITALQVLPITFDIASEIAMLGAELHDPADRTIVATARVHRLHLLTSDQRIITSGLVTTIG